MVPLRINLILALVLMISCTKERGRVSSGGAYPQDVGRVLLNRCAVSGCHTPMSKLAAGDLSLSEWQQLFEGGREGAVVLPFRPDFSPLLFYVNQWPELGPRLQPAMPLNSSALSKEEFLLLRDWVARGSPDINGNIAFANDQSRSKLYVANQLCDLVAVVDAASRLVMRYVTVGAASRTEFPVDIEVSEDRARWYVAFMSSDFVECYDAFSDELVARCDLGPGVWHDLALTEDGKFGWCLDKSSNGRMAVIDLRQMKLISIVELPGTSYPSGMVYDEAGAELWIGCETGNFLTVLQIDSDKVISTRHVILDGSSSTSFQHGVNPLPMSVNAGAQKCIVSSRGRKNLLAIDINTGNIMYETAFPAEPVAVAFDHSGERLFVACMDDSVTFPGHRGVLHILQSSTGAHIDRVKAGYQSSGMCLVSAQNYLAVVNSNLHAAGPAPHHSSGCGGRNGYLTFLDLSTLRVLPGRCEVAAYPRAISLR